MAPTSSKFKKAGLSTIYSEKLTQCNKQKAHSIQLYEADLNIWTVQKTKTEQETHAKNLSLCISTSEIKKVKLLSRKCFYRFKIMAEPLRVYLGSLNVGMMYFGSRLPFQRILCSFFQYIHTPLIK